MISYDEIELIKSQVNMRMLAEHFGIKVNRNGQALCPFHSDKSPSMQVYDGYCENGGYYCWACGSGGDIFRFVQDYCGIGFGEAAKYIAGVFGIPVSEKSQVSEAEKEKIRIRKYHAQFNVEIQEKCRVAMAYLSETIRFYEEMKARSEPFGRAFCAVSNQLPVLQYQWEQIFDFMYDKEVWKNG